MKDSVDQQTSEKTQCEDNRFNVSIVHPPPRQLINRSQLFFSWQANKTKFSRSLLCPLRSRISFYSIDTSGRLETKKPIYEIESKQSRVSLNANEVPFTRGRFYGVKVALLHPSGKIEGESPIRRFGIEPEYSLANVPGPMADLSERLDFLPHAPLIWGQLVTARPRATVNPIPTPTEDEWPDDEPVGTIEPLIWGGPAAVLHLPPEFVRHCNIRWDYSHILGCTNVALQIAGSEGFAHLPGESNALTDPNVVKTLWGPVETCADGGALLYNQPPSETSRTGEFYLPWLDLLHCSIWGGELPVDEAIDINLRLVPTDRLGRQVDEASAHVLVHSIGHSIAIDFDGDTTTTWRWGEVPEREIEFTVRQCFGFDVTEVPSTLLITTELGNTPPDDWEEHSQLFLNDSPITSTNISRSYQSGHNMGCYVVPLDNWMHGQRLNFRIVESWPRHRNAAGDRALPFLYPKVHVIAYPGIGADAPFCGGPFSAENVDLPRPAHIDRDECLYDSLQLTSEGWADFSGWDELYRFFTDTFEGRRISISRREEHWPTSDNPLDWVEAENWDIREDEPFTEERLVSVDFLFEGAPSNGQELFEVMSRRLTATAEMTERGIDDEAYFKRYAFEWAGLFAALTEDSGSHLRFGGPHGSPYGTVMLGLPDRLELDFTVEVERSWETDHRVVRYLDLRYRLNRR